MLNLSIQLGPEVLSDTRDLHHRTTGKLQHSENTFTNTQLFKESLHRKILLIWGKFPKKGVGGGELPIPKIYSDITKHLTVVARLYWEKKKKKRFLILQKDRGLMVTLS